MALLARQPSGLEERGRRAQTVRLKQRAAAPLAAAGRGVALGCCLASACALLACEEPSSPEVPTEVAPPAAAADEPLYDPTDFQRHKLDNGLKTLLLELPSAPLVNFGIQMRRGASSVAPEHAGLARFTTALMNFGAGERDLKALHQAVKELSGVLEISASWDGFAIEMEGPVDNLDPLVEILADVTMRPRFDDKTAENVKTLMLARIRASEDRPRNLQHRFADRALYPSHRLGLPLDGREATLSVLMAEDARDFHSETFVPNNALFFAYGAFDADELLTLVEKAFGGWAPGPMPPAPPPLPSPAPNTRRVLIVDRADLVQNTMVLLAHDGIARQSPDRAAAQLLNKVVEDGTVLMAHGEVRMYREGGSYRLSAVTHSSKVRRVVDQLLSELERVRMQPIPGPELEQARAQILARFSNLLLRQRAVFFALLDLDLYDLPDHSLEDYRSQILEATPEDLVQQARRLLHPDRAAIILVGPAERLLPQLDGLGPVEVVDYSPTPKELNVPSVPTPPRPSDESARGENDTG